MSVFTDLMKSAPNNAQGHKNLETIQAAYEKLDLDGRHTFLKEARDYIKDHKLEGKIAHPRFDAAVFVYQAAVMAEVKDIEAGRNNKTETTPEAIAERKGITESETYKKFMVFKSKLDNHEHPDGLYGPVTHALRYDMKVERMLEQIIRTNDNARHTPDVKLEQPVVTAPAPQPDPKPTPEPVKLEEPVIEKKKAEPNLYLKNTQSFGNAPHQYTGALADNPTGGKDAIFSSESAAKVRVSNTEAGIMTQKDTKFGNLVLNAGLGLHTSKVTAATPNVDVSKLTGFDAGGLPTHVQESGVATGKSGALASTSFLNVNGGAELNIPIAKDNKNIPNFVVGAHAGVGLMSSKINNSFIPNAGINTGGAINGNPLPDGSHRNELGGSLSGVIGTSETHILPSVQLNAGIIKSASVDIKTMGLNLRKTFDIGKDGIKVYGQVGADMVNSNIHHDNNSTITTTTTSQYNPNQPYEPPTTVTESRDVSGYNGSKVNSNLNFSAGVGMSAPLSIFTKKPHADTADKSAPAPLSYDEMVAAKRSQAEAKHDLVDAKHDFSAAPPSTPKVAKKDDSPQR